MRKALEIVADFLNVLMIFLLLHLVDISLFMLTGIKYSLIVPMVILLSLMSSYFFRRRINKLWIYVGAHLILPACILLSGQAVGYIVLSLAFAVAIFLADMNFWTRENASGFDYIHVGFIAVFVFFCIVGSIKELDGLVITSYRLGILFLTMFCIRYFCRNGAGLLNEGKNLISTTTKDMIIRNFIPIALELAIFTVFALTFTSEGAIAVIMSFFNRIKVWIVKFLRWLIMLFAGEEEEYSQLPPIDIGDFMDAGYEAPLWLGKLIHILEMLLYSFTITLIAYFIIKALAEFIRRFATRDMRNSANMTELDSTEVIESISTRKSGNNKFLTKLSNNEKIRRYYKRCIKKLGKVGYFIDKTQTPCERAEDVRSKLGRNIETITQLYTEARYSEHKMESEDVENSKRLAGEI